MGERRTQCPSYLNAATGADIAGATVEVLDSDGNELVEATTDDTGAFPVMILRPAAIRCVRQRYAFAASAIRGLVDG